MPRLSDPKRRQSEFTHPNPSQIPSPFPKFFPLYVLPFPPSPSSIRAVHPDTITKIDFKTLGTTFHNGATANALYLRLNRVKKSVNFTETPLTKCTSSSSSPNSGQSSKLPTAADTVDDAAIGHPYAPTADLPAQPRTKHAAPTGGRGKKRKVEVDGVDGAAEAEDEVGQFEAVNKKTMTPAKKQKQKAATPQKKNGKNTNTAVAVHIDQAAYDAAAAYANVMNPIPAAEDEEGADEEHGDEGV